ncbi:membrane protein [Cryptosporidium canis]|uniref:Membrane protein n=1 Tax=Cryptosporidium canis TaxID=195482 RepID=A0A9D5DMV6_9CRYT|nr:membrane protein [Cryptosporidium canis]
MEETHRFEYEKGNRDEFPQQDQEYPAMPTIQATSPELFTDERAASLVLATRDKFLLLKKWVYYLVYSSLSRFSTSISGERNADQIYKSFVCGQLISVVSAAIWWGFFGTVITFMMESDVAAGNARLVFNLMLIVVSPIARVISERAQMRSILVYVTMARSFVWCTYLPFLYLAGRYFGYKLIRETIGSAQFYAVIALDGALISLLNVVDLDCGGLSFLSHQFGIEITATQKSQAVYTHLTIFDASFILLNPILAFSILCSAVWYNSMRDSSAAPGFGVELEDFNRLDLSQSGIETPIIIIISVFQALSTASILLYRLGMPDAREPGVKSSEESGEYYMDFGQERAQRALESEHHAFSPSPGSITKDIRNNICKFSEGFEFVGQDFPSSWDSENSPVSLLPGDTKKNTSKTKTLKSMQTTTLNASSLQTTTPSPQNLSPPTTPTPNSSSSSLTRPTSTNYSYKSPPQTSPSSSSQPPSPF